MMLKYGILVVFGFVALPALAATQTWDFVDGTDSEIQTGDEHSIGDGTYLDMTVDGVESGVLGAVITDEGSNEPDNVLGGSSTVDYDMALLQFDTAVILNQIDIGYKDKGDDSDMSVLAYTGNDPISGVPFSPSTSTTWSDLLGEGGWGYSENFSDVSTSMNQAISDTVASKYWLVGVYNPVFGDSWSNTNNAVMMTSDPSTTASVPAPGTAFLLAAGLLGFYRRKK